MPILMSASQDNIRRSQFLRAIAICAITTRTAKLVCRECVKSCLIWRRPTVTLWKCVKVTRSSLSGSEHLLAAIFA